MIFALRFLVQSTLMRLSRFSSQVEAARSFWREYGNAQSNAASIGESVNVQTGVPRLSKYKRAQIRLRGAQRNASTKLDAGKTRPSFS